MQALEKSKRGTQYLLHSVDMKELDESNSGNEGERILQKMSSVHFQSFKDPSSGLNAKTSDSNEVIFSKTMSQSPPLLAQQFKGDGSG
jgi:hypothetical protein